MLLVGIDWANDHHDVAIVDESGNVVEEFRFSHDKDGFDELHRRIKRYDVTASEVLVGIETKHGLLVHELLRSGFVVYALNPKAVSRYKDRWRATDRKDDKLDAKTLAHILRTDRQLHRPLVLGLDDYRLLERLCRDLSTVVDDLVRLENRLGSCLKDYYPAAIGSFGMDSDIFYAFLSRYPSPDDLASTTESEFKEFLKDNRYSVPAKKDVIFEHVTRLVPKADSVSAAAGKIKLKSLVEQITVLRGARKIYEKEIKELLDKLPEADIISSLPGVGPRLTPDITAILGPNMKDAPKRFEQAKDIADLGGVSPVTKQSGRSLVVKSRVACDKFIRNVARTWAGTSIKFSRWARAYYNCQRTKMVGHETILRKLAAKWLKIAFHLWRTAERYDEAIYIAELKKRGVVWAMGP